MLSILKGLFGFKPQPAIEPQKQVFSKNIEPLIVDREEEIPKNIEYLIVDKDAGYEEIPKNKWYRKSHWKSEHFLKMKTTDWDKNWKVFAQEKVVGVSFEDRDIKFLRLCNQSGFKIYLEKDTLNEYDSNAIKVMSSAMINGKVVVEQLGFLSRHTAQQLKDEQDLDARPSLVYLPVDGNNFGLYIRVLVRSKRYRDKTYGKGVRPVPQKIEWEPPPWTKEDDKNFEPLYDLLGDKDFRKDEYIKKPSKKLIKLAVQKLRYEGMTDTDIIDRIDRVIEKLLKIKPDLEIE